MSLFNPSRDEVREFFFNAWLKYKQALTLADLEKLGLSVMLLHPEYHGVLDAPEKFMQQEFFPELGVINPFLHMSLHLSVLEQISINQPIGIAELYNTLVKKHQNEQDAIQDMIECLGEMIWQAQRNQSPPDGALYLSLLQNKTQL